MQRLCPFNIFLLPALGATTQQDDESFAILGKVGAVARPPVDNVFADAVKPLYTGRIAKLQTQLCGDYFDGGLRIKSIKPGFVGARPIFRQILFDLRFSFLNGN